MPTPTTPPSMTAPPPAPNRNNPSVFRVRMDDFLAWMVTWVGELTEVMTNVFSNAASASDSATAAAGSAGSASASAGAAASSAAAAATSAGAAPWASGNYNAGQSARSNVDYRVYTARTTGSKPTDPSADSTNWALAAAGAPQLIISTSTANAVSANSHVVLKNAAASTVTLPSAPVAGDIVWVTSGNGRFDNVIARNGQNIMGLAEDMTLDNPAATVCLRFIDSALGWRIV